MFLAFFLNKCVHIGIQESHQCLFIEYVLRHILTLLGMLCFATFLPEVIKKTTCILFDNSAFYW